MYQSQLIPSLAQTETYARAVIEATMRPDSVLDRGFRSVHPSGSADEGHPSRCVDNRCGSTASTRTRSMQPEDSAFDEDAVFRKSSYSQSEAACVEVADLRGATAVRDTQHCELGFLFPGGEWQAFLGSAEAGEQ
jgi:hypothetical protein